MKNTRHLLIMWLLILTCFNSIWAQANKVKIGAYYFDGWTGTYRYHITPKLVDSFPERKPIWGWVTSTQTIMDKQIQLAKQSGLSYFSFCWYYNGKNRYQEEPLNHALSLYLNSPFKQQLKYCLLLVNNGEFAVKKADWPIVVTEWIKQFKTGTYLTVNGKPLVIVFSFGSFVNQFDNSPQKAKEALDSLRNVARQNGFSGVTMAACISADKKQADAALTAGFDLLTGYNYHEVGFTVKSMSIPIDSLQHAEVRNWNKFPQISSLGYIPVTTLNWDPRPWSKTTHFYATSPYFTGYSQQTVYNSVKALKEWILNHPQNVTSERLGLIYAWNENGEGAWLTPSNQLNLLPGVSRALLNK